MKNNVFMISDASYSDDTRCAGLGVIDLYTNKKYSQTLNNIVDSSIAEYRALVLSVQIAIKNKYENVVFVYDNKNLDLLSLKIWLDGKIESFQFLWLKREYVKEADKLARKARKLQEDFHIGKAHKTKNISKKKIKKKGLNDQQIIEAIRKKKPKAIAKFCSYIASGQERMLMDSYFNLKKSKEYTPTRDGLESLMVLRHLLPKDIRNNFSLFVKNKVKNKGMKSKFYKDKSLAFYSKRINMIIENRYAINKRKETCN